MKQSKCGILNATVIVLTQIAQFIVKSLQIFAAKTVNSRDCSSSNSRWQFALWR